MELPWVKKMVWGLGAGGGLWKTKGKPPTLDETYFWEPVPPVNIPIPTKIPTELGGAPIPNQDPIGFEWPNRVLRNGFLLDTTHTIALCKPPQPWA